MQANETQVGGSHYKGAKYQHWDFAADNHLGYFEGQITKYITRWRNKNGIQDLEKAEHFTAKLYELLTGGTYVHREVGAMGDVQVSFTPPLPRPVRFFAEFAVSNNLGVIEATIIQTLATYVSGSEIAHARILIRRLIAETKEEASSSLYSAR